MELVAGFPNLLSAQTGQVLSSIALSQYQNGKSKLLIEIGFFIGLILGRTLNTKPAATIAKIKIMPAKIIFVIIFILFFILILEMFAMVIKYSHIF